MALGASVLILVTGLTAWGWRWAGTSRTELAQWAMAASSVWTLIAAVAAAVYAAGAFKLESDREDRWNDTQTRAQASVVAAWPEVIVWTTERDDDGYLVDVPIPQAVRVMLRNASDVPVSDVAITAVARLTDLQGRHLQSYDFGRATRELLPPTATPLHTTVGPEGDVTDWVYPEEVNFSQWRVFVSLKFTDAGGRTWVRNHDGILTDRTPAPPRATSSLTIASFFGDGRRPWWRRRDGDS